jgi:hypothetical protein
MSEKKRKTPAGAIQLTYTQKWIVYSAAIAIWATGLLWVIFEYFMRTHGEFGIEQHWLESVWQKVHGIVAVAAIFAFGMLWGIHVVRGWDAHWRRLSGGTIWGITLFLSLSGAALYYISNEEVQKWTAIAHWVVGVAAILFFLLHWLSKSRPKRARKKPS